MCLFVDKEKYKKTDKLQKHPKIKDAFVVYKNLRKTLYDNNIVKLWSIYYPQNEWKIGQEYVSDRKSKILSPEELEYESIGEGIHVYTQIPSGYQLSDDRVYVKCVARKKDFVAVDCTVDEAVFMKVKPTKILSNEEARDLYRKRKWK